MPIIHPETYRKPIAKKRWLKTRYILYPLLLLVALAAANYVRPLSQAKITLAVPALPAVVQPQLAWPNVGQAAVGADGYGVLATYGTQTPIATASIAKVITALCVLQKLPLDTNQAGPTFTISPNDIDIYNRYASQDGSVIPVTDGETLTERQALEALLLPSANNIADSLATWVFNGQDGYTAYANQFLTQHDINNTHIGIDASGFDASTTSTASNLVKLGLVALQNPTLLAIASMKSATLPVAGTVYNYDTVLGVNGITGLKTGNNTNDLGAFLFTADATVQGRPVRTVGVVMGSASLDQALAAAGNLAGSMPGNFQATTLIAKNQSVGTLTTAWGSHTAVTTAQGIGFVRWTGLPLTAEHSLQPNHGQAGQVGTLAITAENNGASSPLQITTPAAPPSPWWRLTRH